MEILITNQAEEKLNEILDYVISNFGILVATDFVEKVENTLKLIEF
jgi:plasmid stabilization system protein ParE